MKSLAPYRQDLLIALALLCLSLLFFWPVVGGGRTLLPADIPYQYAPWSASAAQMGVSVPQNHLLADLILENYVWKQFILDSLGRMELPLWNPYLFAGVPFLAAGQHSALYPLSVIFLVLPLAQAYGVFTALQIFIACLGGYVFLRVLGAGRFAAALAGIVYGFSGFMLVSVAFSMVIAAACWLPWALAATELAIRGYDPRQHSRTSPRLLYLLAGSLLLGVQFLAGHVDMSYFILMVLGFYSAWRLTGILWTTRSWSRVLPIGLMLLGMVALGIGLAAVQLAPLFELVRANFRQGSASYNDVVGWALPWRRAISFLVPDFFGNPSQHSYFDLLSLSVKAVTENAKGGPLTNIPENIFGVKNYVESGSYLGILPLLLGLTALARRRLASDAQRGAVWLFGALAVVSLLLAFGTPLYAILFYGLPGYNQLHSPFRWIFPYTLSLSVLAGLGAQSLVDLARGAERGRWIRLAGPGAMSAGLAGLGVLGITLLFREQAADLAAAVMQRSASLQEVFSGGAMLYSYEARNLAVFFVFLFLAGLALLAARSGRRWRGVPAWQPFALVVVVADLFLALGGFNPATDPRLLEFTPGAIRFLQADKSNYRIMGYGLDKPLLANLAMSNGIQDARGYDSIIPKQYADYMGLIEGQGGLLYNRIGDITWSGNLDSQLLDLLGVKYVVTNQTMPNAGFTLVFTDGIRIYRNEDVLPRAFVVYEARLTDPADSGRWTEDLKSLNPRQTVLLEDPAALSFAASGASATAARVSISEYTANRVTVSATLAADGYLVLADSYFPGWLAQDNGQDAPIWRADGNFRAVALSAGRHTVTFKYSPVSLRLGLFASLGAGVILLLGLTVWGWRRFYREAEDDHAAKRVAKNALTPMAANLINKGIDFAFAMLSLRLLGPEGAGRFGYAVNMALFFGIVTDFGLGVLATREVAKDRAQANRYLTNTALVRVGLSGVALLPLLAVVSVNTSLTPDTVAVIALLWASLVPSGIAASLSYLFNAYERFEFPATVTVLVKVSSTFLAAVVLLLGGGIVGLATVSVLANLTSLVILFLLVRRQLFTPRWEPDLALVRTMMSDAYPLMINNLLATIFFRIDVQILQPLKGDEVVGYYNAAYKWIDGLNIIPASLTLALFPLLSRYGTTAKESMLRAYQGSLRLLILVAMPLSVGMWLAAEELMLILGGGAYLPHSMIALRILVWFLPFSFINSVTQYVLIALNQQRFLTVAFIIGVAFNVCANLLLIPSYGYVAAAAVTVASEVVLLAPFYYAVRKYLAPIPWVGLAWRPVAAAAAMGIVGLALAQVMNPLAAAAIGCGVYLAVLLALRTFGEEDRALARRLLGR
jgi:O-antigen/teichoic acid export membrane protein